MNSSDYDELLQYVRGRMISVGGAFLDQDAIDEATDQDLDPRTRLLAYLAVIRTDFRLRSVQGANAAVNRLRELSGGELNGISIQVDERDISVLGVRTIEMTGDQRFDQLLDELEALILGIETDRVDE